MDRDYSTDDASMPTAPRGESSTPPADLRCAYCGAPLQAYYYFCLACGTPYKDHALAVSSALPPVISEYEMIQRRSPWALPVFWSYMSAIVFGSVVAELSFHDDRPDLRMIVQIGAVFITTCICGAIYWKTLAVQLKRFGFNHAAAWGALAALASMLGINWAYFTFLTDVLGVENVLPLGELRDMGIAESTLVVMFCVLPGVCEELAFRGLLQHWLMTAIKPWRALVLASAMFAALHFSVLSFPYLFMLGCLLGWTRWRTGSLYPSMLIHFLHNWIVIAFF